MKDETMRACFMGPDTFGIPEQRNIVDSLDSLARALHRIADVIEAREELQEKVRPTKEGE